ncbi:MAG: glycoside hydrolase family 43 protein [Pleomorphochaeta sp.]
MQYYNNPVSETTKPDPFILQANGIYYCYSTHTDGIMVSISDDLIHFEDKGFAYTNEKEKDFWAPSTIYLNGTFYMYFSSVSKSDEDTLEEKLKVVSSINPLGPFKFEKQLFDYFSIDAQPYFYRGDLYLFYSTNILGCDTEMPGTSILVDKMKNPFEVESKPKIVVKPSIDEEIFQKNRFNDSRDWYTIEGASIIERNNKLYILYSANSYLNENYFINYSVGDLKEDLRDIEFKKYKDDYTYHALMKKNDEVGGTGHNSVCKGPDLIEDYIVYHGRNNDIVFDMTKEQRTMRVDKLSFSGDTLLCDGPSLNNIKMPNQPLIKKTNITLVNDSMKFNINGNYIFDLWIKGISSHQGIRYGYKIGDSIEIDLIQGSSAILVYKINDNIKIKIDEIRLPSDFKFDVPHCFKVKRIFDSITLELEDNRIFTYNLPLSDNLEIYSLYSMAEIVSFSLNNYNILENENLLYLSRYYDLNRCVEIKDNRINIIRKTLLYPKSIGIYSLTVSFLSKDSYILINNKKIDVLDFQDIKFIYDKNEKIELLLYKVKISKCIYKKLQ